MGRRKVKPPVVVAQVINMVCECGGVCENESGSSMIESTDVVVTCSDCAQRYAVPSTVFQKKLK